MIIGIGSDIIDITRIEKVIGRHGERFLDRIAPALILALGLSIAAAFAAVGS